MERQQSRKVGSFGVEWCIWSEILDEVRCFGTDQAAEYMLQRLTSRQSERPKAYETGILLEAAQARCLLFACFSLQYNPFSCLAAAQPPNGK